MGVKTPTTRTMAREGVNAAQTFFEREGCVFQCVDQGNDFGKDAYIDVVQGREVTHLCVAVQIKSGSSYRTPGGDYVVPVEGHASNWRRSTVPVFGIVYDPEDAGLRWGDLTGYLRANPQHEGGVVPIPRRATLTPSSLRGDFSATVSRYTMSNDGVPAVTLLSPSEVLQASAVWDTWALGRHDARHLIILRRVLLDLRPAALRHAIVLLSHATPHPDILSTPKNWIPPVVEREVQRTFRWTRQEIVHIFEALDVEGWGRGSLGQCADMLLYADPGVVAELNDAVGVFLAAGETERATRVATVALSHAHDARAELATLLERWPSLATDEWFEGVAAMVQEEGEFSLYA
jgi:hypothetical protein